MISITIVKVTTAEGVQLGLQATDEHGMQLVLPMAPSEAVTLGDELAKQGRYLAAGLVAPSGGWRPGGGS